MVAPVAEPVPEAEPPSLLELSEPLPLDEAEDPDLFHRQYEMIASR